MAERWVPVSRLLELARKSLDADTWDTCTCDEAEPPNECKACVAGKAWRQAFWSVLDQYSTREAELSRPADGRPIGSQEGKP